MKKTCVLLAVVLLAGCAGSGIGLYHDDPAPTEATGIWLPKAAPAPLQASTQEEPARTVQPIRTVQPAKLVKKLDAEPVYFELDSANLSKEAKVELHRVAIWLSKNPKAKVRVEAYTDSSGTKPHNKSLGAKRAAAVTEFLKSQGVKTSRLIPVNRAGHTPEERRAVVAPTGVGE